MSPRDAAVAKHFYSIDIDGGARSAAVEETIGLVESIAAPLIEGLEEENLPTGQARAELALFLAMARLRTPVYRQHMKSLMEQAHLWMHTEETRHADLAELRRAFRGSEWEHLADDELEAMRQEMVDALDRGNYEVEWPVNLLVKSFLEESVRLGWLLFALDWTLVRRSSRSFVLGDTPVSVYDPRPAYPGSAVGHLTSTDTETFLPLDPAFGVVAQPNPRTLKALADLFYGGFHTMTDEERLGAIAPLEGRWAVGEATDSYVDELNLRSYAHAQRFIYGTQGAVTATHVFARWNRARRFEVTPGPPRIHFVEDHPAQAGAMRAVRVFQPQVTRQPAGRRTARL